MPLLAPTLKTKMRSRIHDGLKRVFASDASKGQGYDAAADANWAKMADAISDIAMDIVEELTTSAQVLPGQQVIGTFAGIGSGPVTATTITPGKIT